MVGTIEQKGYSLDDVMRQESVSGTFGIPKDGFEIDKNGIAIVNRPLIFLPSEARFALNPSELLSKDQSLDSWEDIKRGVEFICGTGTPYTGCEENIRQALEVIAAGRRISHKLSGARIALPPSVGFWPTRSSPTDLAVGEDRLKFNSWLLPKKGGYSEEWSLNLISPKGKSRTISLR